MSKLGQEGCTLEEPEGSLLGQTLRPPRTPARKPHAVVGMWGTASSCAPCWLTPGMQGMRVSGQEDFLVAVKAAESQSQAG